MIFDTVHFVKNIQNNLLNAKKFGFPEFSFVHGTIKVDMPNGYLSWSDLHSINDKDKEFKGNLRKAPKLSYQVLHPGNNKKNVSLHETTIAAAKIYSPDWKEISVFLYMIHVWWVISNSKERFFPNPLGNAIVLNDGETKFFRYFASWVQSFSQSPTFTFNAQTSSALINTLRSQAMLIDELIEDGYDYEMTGRLQSDHIERRFSQYCQMSGGIFLVSLREVLNTIGILDCRSLIKEDINFWTEDLKSDISEDFTDSKLNMINEVLQDKVQEIFESVLDYASSKVATTISGYIVKKLIKR